MLAGNVCAQQLPAGTVIPITLNDGLDADKLEAGKKIDGEVAQEISTSAGVKIKRGSRINRHIVSATKPGASGSNIAVRFDEIEAEGQTIPVNLGVIAIASMMEVAQAKLPIGSTSNRNLENDWVTRQVGGDVVRRGQGKVFSRAGVTGTWLEGSAVRIKLVPGPSAGCVGGPAYEAEQAAWIFSSGACGTYGLDKLTIASSGDKPPVGDIVLKSPNMVKVSKGSAWLLTVVSSR